MPSDIIRTRAGYLDIASARALAGTSRSHPAATQVSRDCRLLSIGGAGCATPGAIPEMCREFCSEAGALLLGTFLAFLFAFPHRVHFRIAAGSRTHLGEVIGADLEFDRTGPRVYKASLIGDNGREEASMEYSDASGGQLLLTTHTGDDVLYEKTEIVRLSPTTDNPTNDGRTSLLASGLREHAPKFLKKLGSILTTPPSSRDVGLFIHIDQFPLEYSRYIDVVLDATPAIPLLQGFPFVLKMVTESEEGGGMTSYLDMDTPDLTAAIRAALAAAVVQAA